jgi:putative methyltransferase (TIGR04325 family)
MTRPSWRMLTKSAIRRLVPEALLRFRRAALSRPTGSEEAYLLRGEFSSWKHALENANGYEDPLLVRRVVERNLTSLQAVLDGDVSISHREQQILSAMFVALSRLNKLDFRVLDFGGELGFFYWSLKRFLNGNHNLCWTVLETEAMARQGAQLFASENLHFIADQSILSQQQDQIDVVLASGALQCVEDPAGMFQRLANTNAPYMIISIFPMISAARDVLTVRVLNSLFCNETYPLWMFSESVWRGILNSRHRVVMEWRLDKFDTLESGSPVRYFGFLLERR